MLELLQFILGGFWRFCGTVILLALVVSGVFAIADAFKKETIIHNHYGSKDDIEE